MANISQIKLPNNTTYDIKDNSGEKSSHIHDSTSFVPIESKTYTGVIAASNDDANCYKYCIKVVPDSYGGQWDIKYRLIATIDNVSDANGNGKQESLVYISGMRSTYAAYQTWNNITNTSYRPIYYHTFRPATEAGISYGHLIGPSLRYAYNPSTSTNKRNITIELLSYHGCTVTFFDSMLIYANVPGTGSTNYNNLVNFDATTQGNTMSGDRNDVNYYNRTNYSSRTTAAALYRYQFCLTKRDGTLVPVNSVNNSVATNKTLTTDTFDPFGEIFFWNSTSTYSANANVGNGSFYRQYLCDLRYSFNCGGYDAAGTLTARQPLYLVCALQSDGMAKLHSSPLSMTLPSSDDGLIYIYLGRTYEDTYPYRVVLTFNHPVYYYKNGRIRELVDTAVSAESASSVAWSGITSKPTTISGYGITDAYTKTEVDNKVSAVLRYKGVKATISALPDTGNVTGDVWHVTATSGEYAWDGTEWQELGTAITIPAATGSSTTDISIADHSTTSIYGVGSSTTSVTGVNGSTSVYGVKSGTNSTTTASKASGANGTAPTLGTAITVRGVKTGTNSTTTASKASGGNGTAPSWTFEEKTIPNVTSAGSASSWTFEEKSIPNVTSAGSASSWTFEEKSIPNVTAAGSGSASLTFTMDTTDTKKLKIAFSHTHTAPTLGTAIKVQSKSGGSNGSAPTLGTAIKVQSKSGGSNGSAPTLGTAIKVQSKSGGSNGSASTWSFTNVTVPIRADADTSIPNVTNVGSASTWSFTDVTVPIRADSATTVPTAASSATTVPIKNGTATTVVTSKTHTVNDSGHTHTI